MQYYIIVSQLNGFALDIDGSKQAARTRVFTWPKHGQDNQQFYDDPSTGTIRSKINNFCLDFEDGQLCMNPFQQGDPNQQWERRGNQVANRVNQNEVLDVVGSDKNQGAKVTKYQFNGGPNQSWTFEFVGGQAGYPSVGASTAYPGYPASQPGYPSQQPGYPSQQPGYPSQQPYPAYPGSQPSYPSAYPAAAAQPQRQEFYIVSEMSGKVIDIKGGSKDAGAQVLMWSKGSAGAKNQRWYLDQQGFIRSALNDMTFTAKSGEVLKMTPATGDHHSQWRFDGNKIINQKGDALDISRESHSDGAEIIAYKQHGKANQRWKKENA